MEKFQLKTKRYKPRKLKRTTPKDYLQKNVLARYTEHQDCFCFYFKKEFLKKIRTLQVIVEDAVILVNSNVDHCKSRSDASSLNNSMEESQCVKEQDYLGSTNTEEENSQDEPNYEKQN